MSNFKSRKDIEDFVDFGNPAETSVQHVNTMLRVLLDVLLDIRDLLTPAVITSTVTHTWNFPSEPEPKDDDEDDTRLAT